MTKRAALVMLNERRLFSGGYLSRDQIVFSDDVELQNLSCLVGSIEIGCYTRNVRFK